MHCLDGRGSVSLLRRLELLFTKILTNQNQHPAESQRVALVHDFLVDSRGAERVFLEIAAMFPNADLFSPIYDEVGTEGRFVVRGVTSSYLNRLRPNASTFRALLPFYPRATESLDFSSYDLVVSSSSAWAHGIKLQSGQRHLCYCHNPFRYAWGDREAALAGRGRLARPVVTRILDRWKSWDRLVSTEVDRYVANSEVTRRRIATSFGRASAVVYPPVDIARFGAAIPGDQFVVVSELVAHKRIDIAVRAFTAIGLPLAVVGDGPDQERLKELAGPTIEFTGRVSDREVEERLSTAAALVQCATEEFGIASVEAQASGRPVIALAAGGALEAVIDNKTGMFFDEPRPEALIATLAKFDPSAYDPVDCRRQAERFSVEAFRQGMGMQLAAMEEMPNAPRLRTSRSASAA